MPYFKKQIKNMLLSVSVIKTKQLITLSVQISRAVMWENEQCGASEIFPYLRIHPAVYDRDGRVHGLASAPKKPQGRDCCDSKPIWTWS